MPEVYFKNVDNVIFTDEDLKMIILDKKVNDFQGQKLIQDEIPYSGEKVTYYRKKENRKIELTFVFDIALFTELRNQVTQLENIIYSSLRIGIYEEGYEYKCNLISVSQENIKKYLRKYTFIFEATTSDRTFIGSG